jgi:hypothetical protein
MEAVTWNYVIGSPWHERTLIVYGAGTYLNTKTLTTNRGDSLQSHSPRR